MTTENTTLIATKLAAETASKAADLATVTSNTAVALASKTAESMAIISTDISWMKKSLSGIEEKLNQMNSAFVTSAQHAEVLKTLDEHEKKLESITVGSSRTAVLLTVGSAILTLLVSLLVFHLFQK